MENKNKDPEQYHSWDFSSIFSNQTISVFGKNIFVSYRKTVKSSNVGKNYDYSQYNKANMAGSAEQPENYAIWQMKQWFMHICFDSGKHS